MKNKGVMISLAVILAAGILITKGTRCFVKRNPPETVVTASLVDQVYETETMAAVQAEEKEVMEELELADAGGGIAAEGGRGAGIPESISPLDTAPAALMMENVQADTADTAGTVQESVSYYMKRLLDLDAQIQKNRDSQTGSNVNSSAKSAASSELKLWDSELNTIYNEILDHLDKEESQKLVEEQRAWLKTRDSLAMEAARSSAGGSRESVEYTVSLTESTRQRAYELAELYAEELDQ